MAVLQVVLRRLARRVLADVAVGVVVGLRDRHNPVPVRVRGARGQPDGEPLGEDRPGQLGADRPALVGVLPGPRAGQHGDAAALEGKLRRHVKLALLLGEAAAEAAVQDEHPVPRRAAVQLAEHDGGGQGAALRVTQPRVRRREIEPGPVPDGVARQVKQDSVIRRPPAQEPRDGQADLGLRPVGQHVDREAARAGIRERGGQVMRAADRGPKPCELRVGVGGRGDEQRTAPAGQADRAEGRRTTRRHKNPPSRSLMRTRSVSKGNVPGQVRWFTGATGHRTANERQENSTEIRIRRPRRGRSGPGGCPPPPRRRRTSAGRR